MSYTLEQTGPIIAQRMRDAVSRHKAIGAFSAVACAHNGTNRIFPHRTLKAAFRSLASICDSSRGRLHKPGEFAAAIVTPEGRVMTYSEVRNVAYS